MSRIARSKKVLGLAAPDLQTGIVDDVEQRLKVGASGEKRRRESPAVVGPGMRQRAPRPSCKTSSWRRSSKVLGESKCRRSTAG